jgi:hypothetical protein
MKHLILIFLLSLSSCLIVKVHQSPRTNKDIYLASSQLNKKMIGSGKIIELGKQGTKEILFFSSLRPEPNDFFHVKDTLGHNFIFKKNGLGILLVVDGEIDKTQRLLEGLDAEKIESISILKGRAALDKYGKEAINGAIEIITKEF